MRGVIVGGLVIAAAVLFAGPVLADGLECTAKTVVIVDGPETVNQIVLNPITIAPACTDPTGNRLTLTGVSSPALLLPNKPGFPKNSFTLTNDLQVGQSQTITFTVTDENGAQATSYITVGRQNPSGS